MCAHARTHPLTETNIKIDGQTRTGLVLDIVEVDPPAGQDAVMAEVVRLVLRLHFTGGEEQLELLWDRPTSESESKLNQNALGL